MAAISNDCDGMSLAWFELLHRFMNTGEETELGRGLGLDISDSIWVFAPTAPGQRLRNRVLSLKAGLTPEAGEDMAPILAHYVRCGWIDTLHSLGDFSGRRGNSQPPTARHVEEAERLFDAYGIHTPVWVNHGNSRNIQNIGAARYMQGGDPISEVFCLPAIDRMGVRYINAVEYHDRCCLPPIELMDWNGHPFWSFSRWYAIYVDDEDETRGIRRVAGKANGNLAYIWHPSSLHYQINQEVLDNLVADRCEAIFAQHLGSGIRKGYPNTAIRALKLLKRYQALSLVLVARVSRLLDFVRMRDHAECQVAKSGTETIVTVGPVHDRTGPREPSLAEARGLCFKLPPDTRATKLVVGGQACPEKQTFRARDDDGNLIFGMRWHPADSRDHSHAHELPAPMPERWVV